MIRNSTYQFWVALTFSLGVCLRFAAAAAPESEKPAKPEKPPEPPITWHQAVVPGPAVTLRVNRPMNKSMVYQGAMEREQKSANSYRETNSFYLNALCASQEDGRDQIALWRTYIDRKRSEKLENGKTIERALENANELIDSAVVGEERDRVVATGHGSDASDGCDARHGCHVRGEKRQGLVSTPR